MTGQYTPVAMPPMDKTEAIEFVRWAKEAQDELVKNVYQAYNRQAHLALGYASWEEMCQGEGLGFYKLPKDKRAPAVVQLKDHGMTNRAIASAMGVAEATVRRDTRSISASNDAGNDQGTERRVDYRQAAEDRKDIHSHTERESSERVASAKREILRDLRHAAIRANAIGWSDVRDEINALKREVESM